MRRVGKIRISFVVVLALLIVASAFVVPDFYTRILLPRIFGYSPWDYAYNVAMSKDIVRTMCEAPDAGGAIAIFEKGHELRWDRYKCTIFYKHPDRNKRRLLRIQVFAENEGDSDYLVKIWYPRPSEHEICIGRHVVDPLRPVPDELLAERYLYWERPRFSETGFWKIEERSQ